ncbi:hypothetical protein A8B78_09865 [Jannaschia sp. EhC01]|nr:hypothetical protein A8B78_09865 [Jannaschia sp. EhC01]
MTSPNLPTDFRPDLDLVLDRTLTAPPAKVWRCWTDADVLCRWFTPPPWHCAEAVIDPRPGGRFFTRMQGPDGEDMPSEGCFLTLEEGRSLSFTDALSENFRPTGGGFMTATVTLSPSGTGTAYRVVVRHATSEARAQHQAMGFEDGWGTAAAQLDVTAQGL